MIFYTTVHPTSIKSYYISLIYGDYCCIVGVDNVNACVSGGVMIAFKGIISDLTMEGVYE